MVSLDIYDVFHRKLFNETSIGHIMSFCNSLIGGGVRIGHLFHGKLRILDIHDLISDMVLLHAKNKAVSLKVTNSVVHNAAPSTKLKDKVDRSPMNTIMSIPQKRHFFG